MEETPFVIVTTTVGSREEADRIAGLIVGKKLAACVQCSPVRSTYRWKGALETAEEHSLSSKTTRWFSAGLVDLIRKEHRYELPEIIVTPVTGGSPDYLRWIEEETAGTGG